MTRTAQKNAYRTVAKLLFLITLACVLLLALVPVQWLKEFDLNFSFRNDKFNHLMAFASLAFVGHFGWPKHEGRLIALLIVLGVLIEALQGLPQIARDPEILDWIADCVGLACGWIVTLIAKGLFGS